MAIATSVEIEAYCTQMAKQAKVASRALALLSTNVKNAWLDESADRILKHRDDILSANRLDLESAENNGLSSAQIDRLRLTVSRLQNISDALRLIVALPDPIGEMIEGFRRPNGLEISRVRVPLGVVFFIYESRPNVTSDAAAICVKSGNAIILRGGKEAIQSSLAIVDCLQESADRVGLPEHSVQMVNTPNRDAVGLFLKMSDTIDVAIPRGGSGLIRRVTDEARMPVIKHFDGNCHVYVDESANLSMAIDIVENSKCQRMGVCNACESLLVHQSCAARFLPMLQQRLASYEIELRGDKRVCQIVPSAKPAVEDDWSTEYLGPILSVRVIETLEEAIDHINRYGSHHTDAIVTTDLNASRKFTMAVDSAAVIVNASTRFNDGGEFGMGAEIGISTDKFHARGPCGLRELTTYKYIVLGSGQTRN